MTQLRPIGTWLPNTTEWLELRLNLHWLSEYQQAEGRNASAWSLKLLDRGSRGIWKGALKASVLKLFSVPNWSGEVIFVFHRLLPFTLFLKQCIPRPPTHSLSLCQLPSQCLQLRPLCPFWHWEQSVLPSSLQELWWLGRHTLVLISVKFPPLQILSLLSLTY